MSTPEDYGVDSYSYIEGVRCKIGTVRTIRPTQHESNEAFQRRIDEIARTLFERYNATSVETDFELAAGGITQCVMRYTYPPRPEPQIAPDNRPAGGRVIALRGSRGGRQHA